MYSYNTFAVSLKCAPTHAGKELNACTTEGHKEFVANRKTTSSVDTIVFISGLLIVAAALIVLVIIRRQVSSNK